MSGALQLPFLKLLPTNVEIAAKIQQKLAAATTDASTAAAATTTSNASTAVAATTTDASATAAATTTDSEQHI